MQDSDSAEEILALMSQLRSQSLAQAESLQASLDESLTRWRALLNDPNSSDTVKRTAREVIGTLEKGFQIASMFKALMVMNPDDLAKCKDLFAGTADTSSIDDEDLPRN